jgi:hypothetical protein
VYVTVCSTTGNIVALAAPSPSFGSGVSNKEDSESAVEFWGKLVFAVACDESVPLVMECNCWGANVLVALSLPRRVV